MTLLEVMLAVALLASLSGIIATAYDSINRINIREQHRLYATEVAHRLILNYLLDPKSLPKEGERIPYSTNIFYRHELIEQTLVEEKSDDPNVAIRRAELESRVTQNERLGAGLKMITVKIYHLPDSGFADIHDPIASVTRIYSPIDASKDEDILLKQVGHLMGRPIELPTERAPNSGGRR